MRSVKIAFVLIILAGMALLLSSCTVGVAHHPPGHVEQVTVIKTGPPPHAPAHGYRHKYHGAVLVFSSDIGVYRVESRHDYYYSASYFYRIHDGAWQASLEMSGPWYAVPDYRVPGKLLSYCYADEHKHKNKYKRRHKHD